MAMFDGLDKIPTAQAPKAPEKVLREMGDMATIIEAQRLYNPQMPSVPSVKPPPAAQAGAGTAGKADMSGSWGKQKNG
jgi:hypothetical protein